MSAYSIATRGLAGRKIPQGVLTPMGELLFAASEPGAWYDPSDMSTLFQDSAGTTPVTAVEQPVGLMLDLSGLGNHAVQATTTKRPVLSRRVNLLTKTDDFSGADWTKGLAAATANKITEDSTTGVHNVYQLSTKSVGAYVAQFKIKAAGRSFAYVQLLVDLGGSPSRYTVIVDLSTGVVTQQPVVGAPVEASCAVANIGSGEWLITARVTQSVSGSMAVFVGPSNTGTPNLTNGAPSYLGDGVSGIYVRDASLTLATDAHLPYQRVNTATDYDADPAKFPAYLRFDGVDDALQTGNIDFTSTDKMTVWAGVTKLSDAGAGVVASCGLLDSGGGFFISAPSSPSAVYGARSRGTVLSALTEVGGYPAPHSAVLCGVFDVAGRKADLRVGGITTANGTDQGVGNFSLRPLAIGANPGGSLYFFNGRLYSLIVRGAQSSLSQIEATELYIKQKMRMP